MGGRVPRELRGWSRRERKAVVRRNAMFRSFTQSASKGLLKLAVWRAEIATQFDLASF